MIKRTYIQNRKRPTVLKNKLMAAGGRGEENGGKGLVSELGRTCTHCYV